MKGARPLVNGGCIKNRQWHGIYAHKMLIINLVRFGILLVAWYLPKSTGMLIKTAWRHLTRNQSHAFINIAGLSVGITISMLIGLWVWDEMRYDRYHSNYDAIAQVYREEIAHGETMIDANNNNFPMPLAAQLRAEYGNRLSQVALVSASDAHLLSQGNRSFSKQGVYVDKEFTGIFTLKMVAGSAEMNAPNTIVLKRSLARALFGTGDAIGKTLTLDGALPLSITGVYEDLPGNASFSDIDFLLPMSLLLQNNEFVRNNVTNWDNRGFRLYVRVAPGVSMASISTAVKELYWRHIKQNQPPGSGYKANLFLHPMKDWRLNSSWKNGVPAGGRIQLVWMFGIIGVFVLILACINFVNLSTARSEKRAKEVGIRKAIGSLRGQLIQQFLGESLLLVSVAFVISMGLLVLSIDWFNQVAGKQVAIPFGEPVFWLLSMVFLLITALLAGSYPALYLSAFQPVTVLKGVVRSGRFAAIPRRVLVVVQFSVSMILVAGSMIVYRQVQYAQNRPAGYNTNGLIQIKMNTATLNGKYNVLRQELLQSQAAIGFAQSSSAPTLPNYFDDRFEWEGQDKQAVKTAFALMGVTAHYGHTAGWQFIAGRDFNDQLATDDAAMILNETAVRNMKLRNPVNQVIKWNGRPYRVVGVIKDMIMTSPYEPVQQGIFKLAPGVGPYMLVKLNPAISTHDAVSKVETILKKHDPAGFFDYTFIDEEYGRKFAAEQRIGVLTTIFAALAIFISCLGIFGLASFVAERRTREMGVRKVLGASVLQVWALLSKEFLALVLLAFLMAVPIAWYCMNEWLQQFSYRSNIAWWVFGITGAGALLITLLTVSYQSLKAALANPVRSLRTE